MTVSGYLSVYNDWDILAPALQSVLPLIDELVVVDGAYSWMAAFLRAIGRDPLRSEHQVHDIIGRLGIPVRYVSGLWDNEIEKRLAGYRACSGRYVLRIDADEVLFFDQDALYGFFAAGAAVAEMEMPTYIAPGWIQDGTDGILPRQAFIFDRNQISAEEHLHYLWLVLTADQLPAMDRRLTVFPDPVAFNAHLTNWRTPETAIQRACFYVLNWNRRFGVPWIPELRDRPLRDVAELLQYITARDYFEIMLGHPLVCGHLEGKALRATPLTRDQEQQFGPCYENYQTAQVQLNHQLRQNPRHFARGQSIFIDVSSEPGVPEATFETSEPIAAVVAKLHHVLAREPWSSEQLLDYATDRNYTRVAIPVLPQHDALRRVLELQFWPAANANLATLICH